MGRHSQRRKRFLTDAEIRRRFAKADRKVQGTRIPSGFEVDRLLKKTKPVREKKRKSEIIAGLEDIL